MYCQIILQVTQVFFSLSITFGIMTAYGSHCHRDENIQVSVLFLVPGRWHWGPSLAEFIGSEVSHESFKSMFVDLDKTELISLFCAVLFVMLFFLWLDSAFSFIDGFLICLSDTAFLGHVNTKYSTLGLTVVAWLLSFMYATDAGLIFLDTIDYYINFVMLLVEGTECFAAGWIYNIEEQVDNLGASIVFSYMTTIFGSVILALS